MYTMEESKKILKQIDKVEDERYKSILRNIVLEITEKDTSKGISKCNINKIPKDQVQVDEKDIMKYIIQTIIDLGIPANVRGYNYIKEALRLMVLDIEGVDKVATRLYIDIAKKYKTTPSRVERGIRYAIEMSCSRGNLETLYDMFGYTINSKKGRPTNSEFIALVSDKIKLEFNM